MMDEFRPPWWLRNRHLQTFLGSRGDMESVSAGTLVHRVTTADGESLALHEDSPANVPPSSAHQSPTVLLIHGLAGSHKSGYVVRIGQGLLRAGWRVLRLDMRGCGAGESWAYKPPHAGLTSDVRDALAFIADRFAPQQLALVGFSLGGNLVLKFLGELGRGEYTLPMERLGLQYAISVSPPIDLSLAADLMEHGAGRIYTAYFMKMLQHQLRGKLELWEAWREQAARVGESRVLRTIREFDDAYTAPLAGFDSAADYYQKSSGNQFLDSIKVPCDLLVAKDDPIVPYASYQGLSSGQRWLKQAPGRMFAMAHGGHLGFIEQTESPRLLRSDLPHPVDAIPQRRWMDRWVISRLVQTFQ
jgi:uncharacterized protein